MIAIKPRSGFPLAVAAIAFAFLGLFLLYPVFTIFKAGFLDPAGHFTLANYVNILSRSFYQASLGNSLTI
ncbi:MAG TPA: hypothetical protein VEC75_09585, partial [Stellaceae bacterium]|nr:hypothetical protein [Stellaceae bacterium]